MASVTASEIPETQQFMGEFWKLIKDFYKAEKSVEYWNAYNDACNTLYKKYNKNRLNTLLMLAFLQFLAEQYGGEKQYRDHLAKKIAEEYIEGYVK